MEIGVPGENTYTSTTYEISYVLYDDRINDGNECTDYARTGTTYAQCIEAAMQQLLMDWYGCLPPWFDYPITPDENDCEVDMQDKKALLEKIENFFFTLTAGVEIEELKTCLPPCLTTKVRIRKGGFFSNFPSQHTVRFGNAAKVKFLKTVYSFDMFDLLVELGSALGLWLGMSALSLLDVSIISIYKISKLWAPLQR